MKFVLLKSKIDKTKILRVLVAAWNANILKSSKIFKSIKMSKETFFSVFQLTFVSFNVSL